MNDSTRNSWVSHRQQPLNPRPGLGANTVQLNDEVSVTVESPEQATEIAALFIAAGNAMRERS